MSLVSGQEHETERERDTADIDGHTGARGTRGDPNGAGEALHDVARTAERGIDRAAHQVRRERVSRGRALTRGFVVAAIYALGVVAMILLAVAAHGNTLRPFDLPFSREVQENRLPLVSAILFLVSAIGFSPYAEAIFIVVFLTLILLRLRLEAIALLGTLIGDGIGALLKLVVNRARPSPALVHVVQRINSPSFPSGHALHYTVFYGFLAFVLITSFRSSWLRNALVAICFALIVLVGISRVYLGEHWATDVLGGYLLGGLFLLPLVLAYLWARAHFDSATLRPLPHPATPA